MRNNYRGNCGCQNMNSKCKCDDAIESKCDNLCNMKPEFNMNCNCGFDDEDDKFPQNPMYGQSYVPIQRMNEVFTPEVGLKMGTIFPELVSPYRPNQSIEEIEYIRATNTIGEGCNR